MSRKASVQVSTVNREKGYIHKTIESLEATGFFDDEQLRPLHLVVGSEDASYLDRYRQRPNHFQIHPMTADEASVLPGLGGMSRAALNHKRCLMPEHRNAGADVVVVIEDDVRFALGWRSRLSQALEGVTGEYQDTWVMTLYTALTDESLTAARAGMSWFKKPWDNFFGTQGIAYPVLLAYEFATELEKYCIHPLLKPYDIALSEFLRARSIQLVATAPCLVQHMGNVSQGVCGHFHQSKGFVEDIAEIGGAS